MRDYDEIHTEQARSILDPKTDEELMDFAADVIAEFCKDPYNQALAAVLKERAAPYLRLLKGMSDAGKATRKYLDEMALEIFRR
jgi:hypothetical protein